MKKIFVTMMMVAALAIVLPSAAQAQCTPLFNGAPFTPNTELHVGQSACIQLCQFSFVSFFLVGDDLDELGVPVLLAAAGCSPTNTNCNIDCTPIIPPSSFTLGGGIFFPNPDDWGGASECMEIAYRWNHDGFWEIEIFSLCEGCFCLTFDHQLAAEISSFDATAGDGEVTVSWGTASESNVNRFEVLRNGTKIHEVAASNSATGSNYIWVDRDVQNGFTYRYQLNSIDMNGQVNSYGSVASATPGSEGVVREFALFQNYPNPFNPETNISFSLPEASNVNLRVFNLLGEEVATLTSGVQAAGTHTVSFDASNLTSGMYIYRLEAGEFSATDRKSVV